MDAVAKKTRKPREKTAPDGFAVRVITLPVAKPVAVQVGTETAPLAWKEFGQAINTCWRECSDLSNLVYRTMAISDISPFDENGKLAKFSADGKQIYAACRNLYQQFDVGTLVQLMQTARGHYISDRFDMYVRRIRSLRSFTHGRVPLPIKSDRWWASQSEDGGLMISFRLGSTLAQGIRSGRITAMLGGGRKHARHAAVMRKVITGELTARDLKLKPGGQTGVVACITVLMPRRAMESSGELLLRTSAQSLLTWNFGDGEDRPPLHFDHVRQILAAREAQQQRWSDDLKFEKRWPRRKRRRMLSRRHRSADRWNNALRTAIQQAAAMVSGVAKRGRVERVCYDDTERSFAPKFAWAELRTRLEQSLSIEGIKLVLTGKPDALESAPAGPQGSQGLQ